MLYIDVKHYICSGERKCEGNDKRSLLFYTYMTIDEQIQQIEQFLQQVLEATPEYFTVSVRIKPTNNVKVFLDGDNGITIESCVKINRKLYKLIEEAGFYPEGEFSLEVSSPGLSEPLKLHRQYIKNVGRFVEVVFVDGTVKEGKLLEVLENEIIIEHSEGKGKKLVVQQIIVPINNIKTTTVQIKF